MVEHLLSMCEACPPPQHEMGEGEHVCMCTFGTYTYVCIWKPGVDIGCLPQSFSTLLSPFFPLLRWASLNPEFTDLARLMASEHQESSISASPAVELQICIIKLSL